MRYISFLWITLFSIGLMAQEPFNKLYNLDVGWSNLGTDFEIVDGEIVCLIGHICFSDTNECSSIAKFNIIGDLVEFNVINDFYHGNEDVFLIENDAIIISGHEDHNQFSSVYVLKGDETTGDYNIEEYLANDGFKYWNEGIIKHQNHYYTYGQSRNIAADISYANIIKWNSSLTAIDTIWNFHYGPDTNFNDDLQPTPDGNLAFMDKSKESYYHVNRIIKVDTAGNEIGHYIHYLESSSILPNLLVTQEGNYVFSSATYTGYVGAVNMLNANMETIEWQLELPTETTFHRRYIIEDYIQAENGDIVACGSVRALAESTEESPAYYDGFITRITQDGELVWLRRYKMENNIGVEEFGDFRPSYLRQIQETPAGGFVAMGYTQQRYPGEAQQLLQLWLLSVNENGCLGEDCDEVTIVTATQDVLVDIVFDALIYPNPTDGIIHLGNKDYDKYIVSDIMGNIRQAGKKEAQIDISHLAAGSYFIQLLDGKKQVGVFQIVKI